MGADMLRVNDGKTNGEHGNWRRDTEVDGSKQRWMWTEVDYGEEGSLLVM
jgi:hypothetical protein